MVAGHPPHFHPASRPAYWARPGLPGIFFLSSAEPGRVEGCRRDTSGLTVSAIRAGIIKGQPGLSKRTILYLPSLPAPLVERLFWYI